MSGDRGSKWSNVGNIRTALRPSNDDREEGQTRGMEPPRKGYRPPAKDPPPPGRPVYGYAQHYPSDPGPQNEYAPLYNSPLPPPQGLPPSLLGQQYQGQYQEQYQGQYQGQYQAGSSPQEYGAPPQPNPYQSLPSQAYGQNQGYMNPPPPASHQSYHPAYQQQLVSSTDQSYQGGQGVNPHSYNQTTYQPTSNSYPPPLPLRPNSQDTQGLAQNPSVARPLYPARSYGESLSRTVIAPPVLQCKHREPGTGLCRDCEREHAPRRQR